MDKRHLYYLFFYCFNLFTITLLASLYYIDVLFFLAVYKIDLLAHFSTFLKMNEVPLKLKYDLKT